MKNPSYKKFICAGFAALTLFASPTVFAEEGDEYAESEASYEAPAENVGMPNPMIEYPDVPTLEREIGFPVMYLPSNLYSLYHPAQHIFAIAGQVADLRFENKADGTLITLRSALKERVLTDDISGCYGFAWHRQTAGDVKRTKVDVGIPAEGARVVKWEAGRFVFSLYITGVDDESFKPILKNFVAVSNRFSYKYRNFTLNPYADINKQAAAAQQAAGENAEKAENAESAAIDAGAANEAPNEATNESADANAANNTGEANDASDANATGEANAAKE